MSACLVSFCPLAAAEGSTFGNLHTSAQEDPAFASSTYFNSNPSPIANNQLPQDDFQSSLTANANPSENPYDIASADNNNTNAPIAYHDAYAQTNDAAWMAQDANNGQFTDVNGGEGPLYFSMDQLNGNFQNTNSTSLADNFTDTRSWPPAASSEVAEGSWNNDTAEDIWSYSDENSSCCKPQCCWGNFRIFGDFLYWNLCQNNLDYAVCARDVTGVPLTDAGLAVPLWFQGNYKIRSVSTKYKPGFRVGGFYSSLCSSWEIGIVYTHLNSSYCNRSRARSSTGLVLPTQLPQTADYVELLFNDPLSGDVPRARSKFHLHYNMLDVLVTTSYCNEGCLTWQPYIGARFLEIKQKWNIRYAFSTELSSSLPFTDLAATSRYHSKLPTGGLTVGVGGAYNICGCWNLIGRVGASCVGGTAKQCTRLNAFFDTSSSSGAYDPARVGKRKCAILTGFEGALGIGYNLECCKVGVQLAIGYEFQTWLNVPSPIEHGVAVPGVRHNPSSNFTLHGLFVRAGVSF